MQTVPQPVPDDPQARILAWLEQARIAVLSGRDPATPIAEAFVAAVSA